MNKQKIKEALGGRFAKVIAVKLNEIGMKTSNGNAFNRQIVLSIIDGRTSNIEAMREIKNIVEARKKELKELLK
ncbi:hypothetical protein [Flavobacterium sp. GCM10023249]|uniref:hypothetical protein n=1 Tax=unclassified Flavobacterium TaxID=196869 RepID=UPI00361C5F54